MEHILSVCLGTGLSAACGFRVFIPLLVMSIASRAGYLHLSEGFLWIGSDPALAAFAAAAVLEIAAYYIPLLDNLLDTIAGPVAAAAGILVSASSFIHVDPLLKWTLAVIAGGGAAAIFHGSTSLLRGASTTLTGGTGNHAVATAELGIASVLSIIAIALPILSIIIIGAVIIFMIRKGFRKLVKPKRTEGASPS